MNTDWFAGLTGRGRPLNLLIGLARRAAGAPVLLAVTALFAMMVMTFFDVVLRSAFDTPIEAATELTRILMAVVVFSALPVISGRAGHIIVDVLDWAFSRPAARGRDAVVHLLSGAMLWWPAERVTVLAERARSYGDVTEYLGIPQFHIAWFIAVFTFVTALVLIVRGLLLALTPDLLRPADD